MLELLSQTRGSLTQTEIAQGVALSVSAIQRVVLVLRESGYIVRDNAGRYRLGSKLFRLATEYPPFVDLSARALPAMQRFADETGESVHLAVLRDDQLLILQNVEGRGLVRLSFRLGSVQEPTHTVSGRTLLAWLDPEQLLAFGERVGYSTREFAVLKRRLAAVRSRGYEQKKSEFLEGIEDLGVPILLPGNRAVAAVTTSFLLPRQRTVRRTPLLDPLKRAAEAIARVYEGGVMGDAV